MTSSPRHFIDLWRFESDVLRAILEDAKARKAARIGVPSALALGAAGGALAAVVSRRQGGG